MKNYDHKKIEPKWQKTWEKKKDHVAKDKVASGASRGGEKKFYSLIEFPYPSGDGLHVGHVRSNTAMDIISRKRRMEGFNVLYPIGWDAFGLPAENYAIKTGINPAITTKKNAKIFERQLRSLGFSFDWSRLIDTTDPKYYKWTQWIFLKMWEKGLAYKKKMAINWCPKDLIGLANEEVVDGCCERCGTPVVKKEKEQWMLAITKYADRLDKDLDDVDFLERIKTQQRNWIGKSEGANIRFKIQDSGFKNNAEIQVFTTRPDTLFGVTYVVLSPEHQLIRDLKDQISNIKEVEKYQLEAKKKTDIERSTADKEKTGVELKGIKAINPANGETVPVWIADYVLLDYGTGAVMAVPAHDERDFEFATKYRLQIRQVIVPYFENKTSLIPNKDKLVVRREIVHAIIKHSKENKYLFIKWKNENWNSFVTGGIEKGEDIVTAGKREVFEETGYKNIKHIPTSGSTQQVHSFFFASHKNENRYMIARGVVFQLENEDRVEISDEEKSKHDLVWVDASKARDFLTHINQKWIWDYCTQDHAYTESGVLIDSGKFTDRISDEVKKEITEAVSGKIVTTYKLRDWVFSRQRYWGEPIPLIYCEKCDWVPVPEKDLPVKLPKVAKYQPTQTGESPLSAITKWVNVKCPKCKGKARRETDTMPNWAGSSWYYLRYTDPKNNKELASKNKLEYWSGISPKLSSTSYVLCPGPVDWYNGGMEHTTLHLLYSRFWHKFLFDIGAVPTNEPYIKRTSHGLILAHDGVKMSKSKGNVINPDEVVDKFGADSLRVYEMFAAPFDQEFAWNVDGLVGARRFVERVWRLSSKVKKQKPAMDELRTIHHAVKKVSEDIEGMKFNTAISALMIAQNTLDKAGSVSEEVFGIFLKILAPFAPHIAEELWYTQRGKGSVHKEPWPSYDPKVLAEEEVTIAIQVNGRVRGSCRVKKGSGEALVLTESLKISQVEKHMEGKKPKKVIYVPDRLINIVI